MYGRWIFGFLPLLLLRTSTRLRFIAMTGEIFL